MSEICDFFGVECSFCNIQTQFVLSGNETVHESLQQLKASHRNTSRFSCRLQEIEVQFPRREKVHGQYFKSGTCALTLKFKYDVNMTLIIYTISFPESLPLSNYGMTLYTILNRRE